MRHPEDEPDQVETEFCERCGDPMPEGCIGECASCRDVSPSERDLVASGGLCICPPFDDEPLRGFSVCGVPCPAHGKPKQASA